MKKPTLSAAMVLMAFMSWAQIPNAGFENWRTIEKISPTGWNTLGNVQITTDKAEGKNGLRLFNDLDKGTFGVFSNAIIQEGIQGGIPYTERPLTFQFMAKYDMDTMNGAVVVCAFKSKGNIIGTASADIYGNSNGQFVLKSVPITWYSFDAPDSILIIGTTAELDGGQVFDNGYMIIDSLHFRSVTVKHAAPVNPGFEVSDTSRSFRPESWVTVDDFIESMGQSLPLQLATRVAGGYEGNWCTRLSNGGFDGDYLPGAMFVGRTFNDLEKPTFRVTEKSTYLNGYYKYTPKDGDQAYIMLTMFKDGEGIGALLINELFPDTAWRPFSRAIGYFGTGTPDSAFLMVSCADPDNVAGTNSVLYIDKLDLSNTFLSIPEGQSPVRIFPNPVVERLYLDLPSGERLVHATLYNVSGTEMLKFNTYDPLGYDLQSLPVGMYVLSISTNNQHIAYKFFKE